MEIWIGVTDASLTDSQTKDSATQLLIKYKSGALVTQLDSGITFILGLGSRRQKTFSLNK